MRDVIKNYIPPTEILATRLVKMRSRDNGLGQRR